MKRSNGFTLAEVLITIGIIGVVAALTIPALMENYREKVFVNRLKESYSIFSQAYKMAINENDYPEGWDIGESASSDGALKLYEYLRPFLKQAKECAGETGCFSNNYLTLSEKAYGYAPKNHNMYSRGLLMNGTAFAISTAGSGCNNVRRINNKDYELCGTLYVDVNGYDKPNKAGQDYFGFFFTTEGISPIGVRGWDGGSNGYTCIYGGEGAGNGVGCTAYVLEKGKMDYLRKDISEDWK